MLLYLSFPFLSLVVKEIVHSLVFCVNVVSANQIPGHYFLRYSELSNLTFMILVHTLLMFFRCIILHTSEYADYRCSQMMFAWRNLYLAWRDQRISLNQALSG